ncbi:PIG-L deacetylase family protein [Cloacibacillus sp. An23]|uniref:PIG-L deacetylase family protein n=1 Tax=Cloacibacillus sp. An23 TaxID=1965591 RepID=UPI000B376BC1|nr:PIG-L deacetylase family protein [Cloacibacillus sp. An23]OUO93091.1 PIG-L domain-containing protein [Cloacibacillus sp. An23]
MNVLIIAPHPDDEILGCGGTIAKHTAAWNQVYVCIVTRGKLPLFNDEGVKIVREECSAAHKYLGVKETIFLDFPAAMLEEVPRHELNDSLCKVVQRIKPEEVYIPHRGDMQLDHKMIVDAAMVALRPKYEHVAKRIYAYETLSETGWDIPNTVNEFIPTVYNDISGYLDQKLQAMRFYQSQLAPYPNPRSIESLEALAKYRGSTVNKRAAEAFSLIREIR